MYLLVSSMKNIVSFEFLLTNLYCPESYLSQFGNYFMRSLTLANNMEVINIFLNFLCRHNLLPVLREDVYLRENSVKSSMDCSMSEEDLCEVERLLLQQEYLSVTDVGLDNGDNVRGYPLPTLVLRIVAQETERVMRKKSSQQSVVIKRRRKFYLKV